MPSSRSWAQLSLRPSLGDCPPKPLYGTTCSCTSVEPGLVATCPGFPCASLSKSAPRVGLELPSLTCSCASVSPSFERWGQVLACIPPVARENVPETTLVGKPVILLIRMVCHTSPHSAAIHLGQNPGDHFGGKSTNSFYTHGLAQLAPATWDKFLWSTLVMKSTNSHGWLAAFRPRTRSRAPLL